MNKIIIFGNSGSGKSTLATEYAAKYGLSHLDLDTIAWEDSIPPQRKPIESSALIIDKFVCENPNWVIEGGYADLINLVIGAAQDIIFLNPGVETCLENCKKRPWEPHKYESLEKQNENLDMLLAWVKEYPLRNDEFSLQAHQNIFNQYLGRKIEYKSNHRNSFHMAEHKI